MVIFEKKKRDLCMEIVRESVSVRHWRLGEGFIGEVSVYKYLGLEFNKNCTFEEFKNRILIGEEE